MIRWWSNNDIEVVQIEGKHIALYGWNGEVYTKCFEVTDIVKDVAFTTVSDKTYEVKPIYKCDEDNETDDEIIGYEFY